MASMLRGVGAFFYFSVWLPAQTTTTARTDSRRVPYFWIPANLNFYLIFEIQI